MPDVHAVRSASSSARWIACPGSIRLCQSDECPKPGTSEYAEEGTAAHTLAEVKLKIALGMTTKADELKKAMKSEYFCGEMDEATSYYRDLVMEHYNGAGDGAEIMIEQRVDFSDWVPGGFGTSDAVIISDDTIEIIDLKYGKGVKVYAPNNTQMRLYALGAFEIFGDLYDFTNVRTTIVQPRLDHVSSEELTVKELIFWGDDIVRPAAEASEKPDAPLHAGEHCRWCPAKAVCRERAEANLELARYDFKPGDLLTADEVGEILSKAEELSKWAEDIKGYALAQAIAGTSYDGWKLVEGRSNRKYTDEVKVSEALQKAGFKEAMLYERKLLGITAMEKLVGKKKLAEVCKDLIEKPAGKPVLVPASDSREAINSAASAADDFKD